MNQHLVAIPLYNKASTITRALDSVASQNIPCDILVIDDGSIDLGALIVEQFEKAKITLLKRNNKGVSATRNEAIIYAKDQGYTYLSFLDADDIWQPHHLEQIDLLTQKFPDLTAYASNYLIRISKRKQRSTQISELKTQEPFEVPDFFKYNLLNSLLTASSFCLNLNKEVPQFDTRISHGEDTDYWIQLGLSHRVAFHPNPSVIIDRTAPQRATDLNMNQRDLIDLDQYNAAADQHEGLAQYLDLNRFSIAIAYRMENDIKKATEYQHKINPQYLSDRQKRLLSMNRLQLKSLKKTQRVLGHLGLRLRTGS